MFVSATILALASQTQTTLVPTYALVAKVEPGHDRQIHTDSILSAIGADPNYTPTDGEAIGTSKWKAINPDAKGNYNGKQVEGGWLALTFVSPANTTMLLNAAGQSMGFWNGSPEPGDVYEYGYLTVPVQVKQGPNELLLFCPRGEAHAQLLPMTKPISLDTGDLTLPDVYPGMPKTTYAALELRNGTDRSLNDLTIVANDGAGNTINHLGPILPISTRKVGFAFHPKGAKLTVTLKEGHKTLDTTTLTLRLREKNQTTKRTFVSSIDTSVQYYAVNPAQTQPGDTLPPALILSLHGASVEAIGQADAYSGKTWANIVCPTNRRPFGFDWEDWGRLDGMEVLGIAEKTLPYDHQRVYLTGHSMGGHGTYRFGALFPSKWAAFGASAAWISSYTYAGLKPQSGDAVEDILGTASNGGDTKLMLHNYGNEGVYILQGEIDDNVPPTEAKEMIKLLTPWHKDFQYHFQPGANHWWDASPEPGADAVDYAPMFDFLNHHVLPRPNTIRHFQFTTLNPGISAKCYWATIVQQTEELQPSTIDLDTLPYLRRVEGTTKNVAALDIDTACLMPGKGLEFDLDGQTLKLPIDGRPVVHLALRDSKWEEAQPVPSTEKNPMRYGPIKSAFNHNFIFIYGTQGTPAETAEALAKARFDAESWWYRANGSVDVLPDTATLPAKMKDDTVVLYGNSATNKLWNAFGTPQIAMTGDADAMISCAPKPGSDIASVIYIGWSDHAGAILLDGGNYLQPMIGFPDYLVMSSSQVAAGKPAIVRAGFFDKNWKLDPATDATR